MGAKRHTTANGVRVAGGDRVHVPVGVDDEGSPVEHDELAAEVLHGAQPEVTVGEQLADGGVAVEATVDERVERADLERGALDGRIVREPVVGERAHVQRADQPIVDDVRHDGVTRQGRTVPRFYS